MPDPASPAAALTLHAVRLLGFADTDRVAARYGLDRDGTASLLEDFRADGWVRRSEFAGTTGWSLTDLGRAEDERLLADELAAAGASGTVRDVHERFVPSTTASRPRSPGGSCDRSAAAPSPPTTTPTSVGTTG